jgi:hypothetical protein
MTALRSMSPKQLATVLHSGQAISPEALHDSMYRGVSLGIPHWVESLAWTTFMKAFYFDPDRACLRGWNVKLAQTGLDGPVEKLTRGDGAPMSFGHFEVVAPRVQRDGPGLLIDYGLGRNVLLDPSRFLRDPIVALKPGNTERLLGFTYLDFSFALPTPSYFLLERVGRLDHIAVPPR